MSQCDTGVSLKRHYSEQTRKEAVLYALKTSQKQAAKEFNVARSTIRTWIKKFERDNPEELKAAIPNPTPSLQQIVDKIARIADLSADRLISSLEAANASKESINQLYAFNAALGTSADKLAKLYNIDKKTDDDEGAYDMPIEPLNPKGDDGQ